jgi:hypothetical protein
MRRNSSTVVVLAGQVPGEVLAAAARSLNVTLYRPEAPAGDGPGAEDRAGDGLAAAAVALQRAGRSTSPYALVPADPLAAVAARWQEMWDLSKQPGPAAFELEAAQALAAQQAAGVLHALGSLRHGPWWPGLDQVIETARRFYPASLAEENTVLAQ